MKVERWQLKQRQSQPLALKILMSRQRVKQWHEAHDGRVCVAFSGGLDSTALLHLVRDMYPDTPAVFYNTGVEYPEIVRFVKATPNVDRIKPRMRYPQVIKKYGYPVVSKRMAQYISEVQRSKGETATKRLRLTGIRSDGTSSPMGRISNCWLFLCNAPFPIHDACCDKLKKNPAKLAEATYGAPMLGMRVDESGQRAEMYLRHGCNAFHLKRPRSWPMAFWSDQDVLDYIDNFQIPYSEIYDMGYTRTGCFPCMFGAHLNRPNRFQRMHDTHPKLWSWCLDTLGQRAVMDYVGIPYMPDDEQLSLW